MLQLIAYGDMPSKEYLDNENIKWNNNKIYLINACKKGHLNKLKKFYDNDLTIKTWKDILYCSCENNHIHIAKWIWNKINTIDKISMFDIESVFCNAFYKSSYVNNLTCVKWILTIHPRACHIFHISTIIMECCEHDWIELFELIYYYGVIMDLNAFYNYAKIYNSILICKTIKRLMTPLKKRQM